MSARQRQCIRGVQPPDAMAAGGVTGRGGGGHTTSSASWASWAWELLRTGWSRPFPVGCLAEGQAGRWGGSSRRSESEPLSFCAPAFQKPSQPSSRPALKSISPLTCRRPFSSHCSGEEWVPLWSGVGGGTQQRGHVPTGRPPPSLFSVICGVLSCAYLFCQRWFLGYVRRNPFTARLLATE